MRGRRRLGVTLLGLSVMSALGLSVAALSGWIKTPWATRPAFIEATPFAPPPAGPVHLLFVGTSLSDHYDWPDAVADRLHSCLQRPVTLSRVTRGGASVRWGAGAVAEHVNSLPPSQVPDVIVLEFTVNDADLRHRLSPRQSAALTEALLRDLAIAAPEARVLLLGMYPGQGLRGLLRMGHDRYLRSYVELAQTQAHIGFLDLAPAWRLKVQQAGRVALPDGLHPTQSAARQVNTAPVSHALEGLWNRQCAPT